ncbi:helix-turn-helix transcriptional regulator [Euzebya tangerina]|uniref:helix-turn-helix transcriptional regulator n=1 Tax=Euzebya tangerina TaxID=591198 RepID=UPI000E3110A0|nr:HTH domain-containing protein [Euzebya tangerina]
MRAARALDMLLYLQRQGQTTAGRLAEELEVSERTILRDVEVLSEAGIPIYTVQGPAGGIALLDGFQTDLTGLTTDDVRTLFLVGQPRVAHRLGLAAAAQTVRAKLVAALPTVMRAEADRLGGWFLHDPDPWEGHQIPHGELRRVALAITRRREIELTLAAGQPAVRVQPLGLVLKAGEWLLVHQSIQAPAVAVTSLRSLRATRLTSRPFVVPEGFSLDRFWHAHLAEVGTRR